MPETGPEVVPESVPDAAPAAVPGAAPDAGLRWQARPGARAGLRHEMVSALVGSLLQEAPEPALVVDLGGGAGALSVELAQAGHDVVVVDPSPDALAALGRRAREAGVADRVRAVQGEAATLATACERPADVLLCHDVLELVDDPAATLADIARCLRSGGALSLLAAQRGGTAVARAVSGRVAEAVAVLADPLGRTGADDPWCRRLDAGVVDSMLAATGFDVVAVTGCPVLADLVPETVVEGASELRDAVRQLESEAARHPDLLGLASHLHWHALRR